MDGWKDKLAARDPIDGDNSDVRIVVTRLGGSRTRS
jgi:hypothetical protein